MNPGLKKCGVDCVITQNALMPRRLKLTKQSQAGTNEKKIEKEGATSIEKGFKIMVPIQFN